MKLSELKEYLWKGAVAIVQITPFDTKENLDLNALRENTQFLVEHIKYGPMLLVPLGSTGEFYAMNFEEYKRVVDTVVDVANGKVPVVPGAAHSGTRTTIEYVKYIEDIGADGVQIVLPYYHVPNEEGLYLHYKTICEKTDIGVIIYNNPDVAKVYMKPHLLKKLVDECDNIVAVKENTPYIPTLYKHILLSGNKVPIYQGRGEWWYMATATLGVRGYVSSYANFMPKICLDILKAGLENDTGKLKEFMNILQPYNEFIEYISMKYGPSTTILPYPYSQDSFYISVIKATMNILGLKGGVSRLPLTNLKSDDLKALEDIVLNKLKLQRIK